MAATDILDDEADYYGTPNYDSPDADYLRSIEIPPEISSQQPLLQFLPEQDLSGYSPEQLSALLYQQQQQRRLPPEFQLQFQGPPAPESILRPAAISGPEELVRLTPTGLDAGEAWRRLRESDIGHRLFGPTEAEKEAGVLPGMGSPGQAAEQAFQFTTLPPPAREKISELVSPMLEPAHGVNPVVAGGIKGAGEFAADFPLLPLGGGNLGRAAMGVFAGQYAAGLNDAVRAYNDAMARGDTAEAARIATQTTLGGAATIVGGAHALTEGPRPTRAGVTEPRQEVAVPVTEGARQLMAEQPTTGEPNARSQQQAAEVYGDMRTLAGEGEKGVPVAEGGGGVQPQATGRLQPPGDIGRAPSAEAARAREVSLSRPELPTDPVERSNFEQDLLDVGAEHNKAVGLNSEVNFVNVPDAAWLGTVDTDTGKVIINRAHLGRWMETLKPGDRIKAVKSLFSEEGIHGVALSDAVDTAGNKILDAQGRPVKLIPDHEIEGLWNSLTDAERSLIKESYGKLDPNVTKSAEVYYGHEYLRRQMQRMLREPVREKAEAKGYKWLKESAIDMIERVVLAGRRLVGSKASKQLDSMLNRMADHIDAARKAKGMEPVDWKAREAEGVPAAAPRAMAKGAAEEEKPPLLPSLQDKSFSETVDAYGQMDPSESTGYKGKNGQNATGLAWDIGSMAKTPEDVAKLKQLAEDSASQGKELMAKGDYDAAMKFAGKQTAEAYEFATGVKLDGTPKWPILEKFVPGYEPPVPDAKYTAAKAIEPKAAGTEGAPRAMAPTERERTNPLRRIVEAFKPKAQGTLPEVPSTAHEALPDLGSRTANKAIAVEPTGIGRIPGLNWLFDPRHRVRTEPEKAIAAWFYEQAQGKAHVQALGSSFGDKFKNLFPRNEAGEFANVGRTTEGQSLHPSDVFEGLQRNPEAYNLSPEQRAAFNELMTYENRARQLEKQYGIRENPKSGEIEEGVTRPNDYYTRGRAVGEPARKGVGGGSMGGRQFFQKPRAFRSEQQGANSGFKYPLNVDDRILLRLGRLYKAIADRRLAHDEGLGGRWGSESGPLTYHEGQVFQPAFRRGGAMGEHRIFPADVAAKLQSITAQQTPWLRVTATVNDFIKGLSLGFDYGAGQIQGLVTAFRDPKAWAQANVTALKSFTSPEAFAQYVRNNQQAVRELAQYGSGVGSVPEQIAGLGHGGALVRLPQFIGEKVGEAGAPRLGKAISATSAIPQAFGRIFQTFLDVAKVERWKAVRETTPRAEWPRAIQEIEHELNMGRMEAIGVGPGQALAERVFLLAPSYYRGALGLVGDMTAKGTTGTAARRAMGSYMAGTVAVFAAAATAAGLSWDEIKKRMDPSKSNFLMVPVKLGGKTMEVGFGGVLRSFMRLAGNVVRTSVEHPENWKSLSSEKNPFVKWLRGHSAPVPSTVWNQFSGSDYLGQDTDIRGIGTGVLPLWIQDWAKANNKQPGALTTGLAVSSILGLNAYPQSIQNQMMVDRDKLAQKQFGKSYESLPMKQQATVSKQINRLPEYAIKPQATPQQIERAFRNEVERQQRVQGGLDKSVQEVIQDKGLRIRGYAPRIRLNDADVILTDKQVKRYEALLIEEYNRVLKPRVEQLRQVPAERTPKAQERIDELMQDARERARKRLQHEFSAPPQ